MATVLDAVRNAVVVVGTDGRVRFSNAANNRLLGYTSEEIQQLRAADWIHPDDFGTVLEQLDLLGTDQEQDPHPHIRLIHRDGGEIPVSVFITDMTDDPMIRGVVATMRDLTSEVAAASLLAESEERHRVLLSVIPDAVVTIEDGVFTFGNSAAVQMFGAATSAELAGMSLSDFQPPDVAETSMDYLREFRVSGTAADPLIAWIHRIDGTPIKVEAVPATVPGNDRAILLMMRDATDRDRMTAELAESEAVGRFLTENSTDVLLRVDEQHHVVFATPSTGSLLDQRPEHVVGAPLASLFVADDGEMVTSALAEASALGDAASFEARARRTAHGQYVWVEVTIRAITLESGDDVTQEFHVAMSDITRQHDDRAALAASERWMRTLVDGAPIGIFELDPESNCTFVNAHYVEIMGIDGLADVAGQRWQEFIHPDDRQSATALRVAATRDRKPFEAPLRFIRPDGRTVLTEIGIVPVLDGDHLVSWLGTVDDVTERIRLEQERREAAELFVVAFDHAPTGLALTTVNEFPPRLVKANHAQLELTGLTYEQLTEVDFFEVTHPDDVAVLMTGRAALLAGEIDTHHMEVRQRFHPDRDWRWFSVIRSVVSDVDGRPSHIIAQTTDITDRKRTEHRHYQLAVTDHLTGLSNRRHFEDRLANTHSRLLRSDVSLGVVFVDLDRFKDVNDGLGHRAGDELLQKIAELIASAVRPGDTVARLGGDEFAVLTELDDEDDLVHLAERLRAMLDVECELPGGVSHRVTASIGLASRRASDVTPDELVQLADQAMYRAKREGRHRWAVADAI